MKRTNKIKQVDAILTGDWHLRDSQPICRTDDFQEALWKKVDFIAKLADKYGCPVLHSGDLFHHWKPSPYLISKALEELPFNFWTNYGNHDLPQHNLEEQHKSGIYALDAAFRVKVLQGVHWGQEPEKDEASFVITTDDMKERKILVWHVMTYQGEKPWPGCEDPKSAKLLRKYKNYDLILTGHNHKPFVEEHEGRILVNPGSISRQEADQIDFRPRVYLYHAESNSVTPVYLPIDAGVVTRQHLERSEERDNRIDAFVSKLGGEWEAGMNFERNLEEFFAKNKVRESVKQIIYNAIEQ